MGNSHVQTPRPSSAAVRCLGNAIDPSSNQLQSAARNLQAPHGSRSATVSPPGADGGEGYVIANSGRSPHSKLSSPLAARMQQVRASTQASSEGAQSLR